MSKPVKFAQPFAIALRRVSLRGFKRILQRSTQNLFKKVGRLLYVQKRRNFQFFITFFAFFPKIYILHYFAETKKKKETKKRKESLLQRIKKCPVVSFEKEAKSSIQDILITTRSLNHKKLKKKKSFSVVTQSFKTSLGFVD